MAPEPKQRGNSRRKYAPDVCSGRAVIFKLPEPELPVLEKEIPLLDRIPRAFWDGIIEAAKHTGPLPAFGLGFFKSLQNSCEKINEEERIEAARVLRSARFEDIEAQLNILGLAQKEIRQTLSRLLRSVAEREELEKGMAPSLNAVLEASRQAGCLLTAPEGTRKTESYSFTPSV